MKPEEKQLLNNTIESVNKLSKQLNGFLDIYTYSNGSNSPLNSSTSAITLMQSPGLTYTWDITKTMTRELLNQKFNF